MAKRSILGEKSFAGYKSIFGNENDLPLSSDSIVMLPLKQLKPFYNHPFKVRDDAKMDETVESIRTNGVLVPIIVRKKGTDCYEIISGHRRKHACEILGLSEIPAMIRELSDDEATIIMVDANLQREQLDFSEKAFALKMKLDALKHQGCRGLGDSAEELGEETGESGRQIRRYIRLTELIPAILEMVDAKKIGLVPAVELSYLSIKSQEELVKIIIASKAYPSQKQARKLREYEARGELTPVCMEIILNEGKEKEKTIVFKPNVIERYFPEGTSKEKMEEIIISLLEKWNAE